MTDRTDDRRIDEPSESGSRERPDEIADGPDSERPSGVFGWIRWFRTVDSGPMLYVRDLLTSVAIVLFLGAVLFAISGVWPPMVAIESGSMEPNMERGDLVFVVDDERFTPEAAPTFEGRSTGVVPADLARAGGERNFGEPGDVIVFRPNGNTGRTPVIHRAMLWVEGGENWYDRADPGAVGGADSCAELDHCPAPHAGFITKGDNARTNARYDQVTRLSSPVRPEWIVGTAELRIPYLGYVRLILSTAVPADGSAAGTDRPTPPPRERPSV
jgi:signal peptidase